MMERPARQALKRKISDVENSLETSLAQGATDIDLARHDESLQSLDRLLQRFPTKKNPSWLLPLSVAVVAMSLLGIAAAIRLSAPLVTVDARLSAMAITAAADGAGLVTGAAIPVKSLEVAGDAKAQAIAGPAVSVSSLKLMAGTTALLEQRGSCIEVQLPVTQGAAKPALVLGLDLVVMHPPKTQGQLPTPAELRVFPGTTVSICGDLPANYALAGNVGRIDLYRRQPGDAQRGFVDLRTPSIISGKLRLPNFNRATDLQDTDMVSFDGVARGWVFVFPAPAMRVVFSGKVDRPVSVSPTPEGGSASLAPTLLEWLTKSPLVTAAFGLVTGFVGMLWGLAKYFGLSAR
jgi:hypothetical protein